MGRKPKTLTDEQKAQVEALAAYLSQDQIADYFGTTRPTFAAMIERDEEISLRYKRGKAKAIGTVAQGLLQQARDGNMTAAIFYLKTQAGWREAQSVEHSGKDGGPIQTEDVTKRDADAFVGELSRLIASAGTGKASGGADPGSEGGA